MALKIDARSGDSLQHAAVVNCYLLLWRAARGTDCLYLHHSVHSINYLAEDDVTAIEPLRLHRRDEELRSIRVRPRVGHAQDAWPRVLELEVLVCELRAIDALAAGAIAAGEVAALNHEIGDDAVEGAPLVVQRLARLARAFVASAEGHKVGHGLWHDIAEQTDGDP